MHGFGHNDMTLNRTTLPRIVGAAMLMFAEKASVGSDDHWLGRWKLNRALSDLTGPSITINRVANGYHFDFGAVSFDVGDDGNDYTTIGTRSTSLKVLGEHEWFRVHKIDCKDIDHSTLTITPDKKTLLIHTLSTDVDRKTHESDEMETRVGGGTGLAGMWQSTTLGVNVSEVIVIEDAGNGKMRRRFPGEGQFYVAVPNGPPAEYAGPRSVPGVMVKLRTVSAAEMRWTELIKNKPLTEGIDRLSADRKQLHETTWPVQFPMDKQEAVYEKQ